MKKILITGAAGFIGFHLVEELLNDSVEIVGLDILNDYYEVSLKIDRLNQHGISSNDLSLNRKIESSKFKNYSFIKADLSNHDFIVDFMIRERFDVVVNLAAQAGVRYSLDNPKAYVKSNVEGFLAILEGARVTGIKHLLYASTSSVYGIKNEMPLVENMSTDRPISLYAATKKSNELMAYTYSHLFNIPITGLRFFTVYGPWGRPDMALFLFTKAILNNSPINVYNHGNMIRDFTYVKDISLSIKKLIDVPPIVPEKINGKITSDSPQLHRVLNIGSSNPVLLSTCITELENVIEKKAIWNSLDIQPGDVYETHADTKELQDLIQFKPETGIKEGVRLFYNWYKSYYN